MELPKIIYPGSYNDIITSGPKLQFCLGPPITLKLFKILFHLINIFIFLIAQRCN